MGVWPQPLETQAQAKVQLEKFQYPTGAKGELLGPGRAGCADISLATVPSGRRIRLQHRRFMRYYSSPLSPCLWPLSRA